ncbi:hypothetical protein K2173_017361 [Erythroxylum novogranatense]|uniref:Pectinesterase inhibitor domain-containing protein n=1 Tax=Erythroxylum novogranatense TaxID=1862640 RepID=A0AAV8TK50_9ROSI|nr:hypothetical protein K2173_017361 [Erythroxylum novogranatense]
MSLNFLTQTFLIILLVLLPTHFSYVKSDAALIDKACKSTPNYKKCVSIINTDPGASKADITGLAIIALNAVDTKSHAVMDFLYSQEPKTPALKHAFSSCYDNYYAIINADVLQGYQALQKGQPMIAQTSMNDAGNEANSCEHEFKGKSPMTSYNTDVHDTAAIASALTQLLL